MIWYLDALDVRAGLAIASRRESDDLSSLKEDGPIAFIAPPAFAPEFLSSRASALAMARAYAQLGLFNESGEIPFDSLDAVVEFVRRVFLRRSGGDGPAGGGGGGPPEPEGSPGEGEGPPIEPLGGDDDRKDPVAALRALSDEFAEMSSDLQRGVSKPAPQLELINQTTVEEKAVAASRLARGAFHLLREVRRKKPRGLPAEDHLDWFDHCSRLISAINRLGIGFFDPGELQFEGPEVDLFRLCRSRNGSIISSLLEDYPFRYRYWESDFRAVGVDPVELLERLPVPKMLALPAPDSPNLMAALSAAVADPAKYFSAPDHRVVEARGEIVLLAAALLNVGDAPLIGWWQGDVCLLHAARAADRGQRWLARNMPKHLFAKEVEMLIGEAVKVAA